MKTDVPRRKSRSKLKATARFLGGILGVCIWHVVGVLSVVQLYWAFVDGQVSIGLGWETTGSRNFARIVGIYLVLFAFTFGLFPLALCLKLVSRIKGQPSGPLPWSPPYVDHPLKHDRGPSK